MLSIYPVNVSKTKTTNNKIYHQTTNLDLVSHAHNNGIANLKDI